jgi:hypothetical protein
MGIAFALIGLVIGRVQGRIIDDQFNGLIANQKSEHIIVRLPKLYKWVGVAEVGLFAGFIAVGVYSGNDTFVSWVAALFCVAILMGAAIIWVQHIWRVDIYRSEDYFLYVTSFGIKHKIKFSEIDYYIDGVNYVKLKLPRKTYWIDNKAQNVGFLTLMLHERKVKKMPTQKKWYEH